VPLVFKGGTSLMLRLPQPRRLSIDVDILCQLDDADLDAVLNEVGQTAPFLRYEEDQRDPNRLPARRHFKFYYQPMDAKNPGPFVLLDVVKEGRLHPQIGSVPIQSPFFEMEEEIRVEVPTVEGLLGDKLTAFAPNTVGVPCTDAMQVMKQVFDVAALFDATTDFEAVARAYEAIFNAENSYRGGNFTIQAALTDTVETARRICHYDLRGAIRHEHQAVLEKGRKALLGHLLGVNFDLNQAKAAAAKAAFLATRIRNPNSPERAIFKRYESNMASGLTTLSTKDPVLDRLKSFNEEAFYYWTLASSATE
jgi:predicted nucleotidyltransferase component of viral defense system